MFDAREGCQLVGQNNAIGSVLRVYLNLGILLCRIEFCDALLNGMPRQCVASIYDCLVSKYIELFYGFFRGGCANVVLYLYNLFLIGCLTLRNSRFLCLLSIA